MKWTDEITEYTDEMIHISKTRSDFFFTPAPRFSVIWWEKANPVNLVYRLKAMSDPHGVE